MDGIADHYDALLRSGARRLTGYERRLFPAEVATELCGGSARLTERRFGWGRQTVQKGLHEWQTGVRCLENFQPAGLVAARTGTRNWRPTSEPSSNPIPMRTRNSSPHDATATCPLPKSESLTDHPGVPPKGIA